MKKLKLSILSLADLIALHTNYWLADDKGARFTLIDMEEFEAIETELRKRIYNIDFNPTNQE